MFSDILSRNEEMVYNLILRMVRNPELAEDLTQEVFVRVYRSLRSFEGRASLSTWIYRVAYNVAMSELAKARYRHEMGSLDDIGQRAIVDDRWESEAKMLDKIDQARAIRLISRMIDELRPEQRGAIALYYQGGKSYREISEIMGIPIGTVKTILFRAKTELRRRFKAEEGR